jgi:hypothetical protein
VEDGRGAGADLVGEQVDRDAPSSATPSQRVVNERSRTNPERCSLIAPFESDAAKWGRARFTNVYDDKTWRIRMSGPGECLETGIAWVYSYRDVAEAFLRRPQAQLQTPDGRRCPPSYRGLLVRRAVTPADERPIGKEGNHIADVEAGLLGVEDVLNEYQRRDPVAAFFDTRVRPALKTFTVAAVIGDCAVSARTVERVRAGDNPTPRHRTLLFDWCYEQVGRELKAYGVHPSFDPRRRFDDYLRVVSERRVCARPECDNIVTSRRRRFCSKAWREAVVHPVRECQLCGKRLKGRRRRWCCDEHRREAPKAMREPRLCECGCGECLTGRQRRYKPGHESSARRTRAPDPVREQCGPASGL